MKTTTLILIAAVLSGGCKNKAGNADAFGNFEATEIIISAETNGRILRFDPVEGTLVDQGATIALIDTTVSHLQIDEIDAARKSIITRITSINSQNDILNQQIDNLNINISRTGKMLTDGAATQKQYDDLTGQLAVLQKQISANNTQKSAVAAELNVNESRKATVNEQIKRCTIKSPIKGTVIEKYSQAGEITAAGKPLIKIADLSVIKLKVFISGAQLRKIKTGQTCTVRIDDGEKKFSLFTGTISYIGKSRVHS